MTTLAESLAAVPVIGIARRCPPSSAGGLAAVAARAGLRSIEFTMEDDGAGDAITAAREHEPELAVGAGTVTSVAAARRAISAGASFLVAPGFDEAVVRCALSAGVDVVPGVLTPTEVGRASELVSVLKLFPAGVMGPSYLRALREPFGGVSFVCTGGVNVENARSFLDAGALAVGIGGAVFPDDALRRGDFDEIEARLNELVAALRR